MRIVKLFLLVALSTTLVCGPMNAPCYAASPTALCESDRIAALHGDDQFLLASHEVMMHASLERETLSRVLLGQEVRARLPGVSALIILERFDPHDQETYTQLATTAPFVHLLRYAAEERKNVLYIGLASPPNDPALMTSLNTLVKEPQSTSQELLHRLCRQLPSGYQLSSVKSERGLEGTSWQIRMYDARGAQIAVLAAWLDATQTRRARATSWLQWGGVMMLMTLALVVLILLTRRRRRRLLPAWKEVSSDGERCSGCGRASPSRCGCVEGSGVEGLVRAHEQARGAREEILSMLKEIDVLVRRSRRPLVKLLGTSSLRVAFGQLHATQAMRLEALRTALVTQWFEEAPTALSDLLAARAHQQPPYIEQLHVLLVRPLPEFSRVTAPEPWMSHLSKLHALLDVVVLELELQRRVALPPSGRGSRAQS